MKQTVILESTKKNENPKKGNNKKKTFISHKCLFTGLI